MAHSILIVEDNAVMANLLQFNLKRAGFDVVVASNGVFGLEEAESGSFDLIVTDHQMPSMTGVELCRALRQMPKYLNTPVLLCTAKGLELQRSTLQEECGITDIIFKPVSPRLLISRITELLKPTVSGDSSNEPVSRVRQSVPG